MEEKENKMVDTWIQQALSSCESHKELGGANLEMEEQEKTRW